MEAASNPLGTLIFYLFFFIAIPAIIISVRKSLQKKNLKDYIKDIESNDINSIKEKCDTFITTIKIPSKLTNQEMVLDKLFSILSIGFLKGIEISFVRKIESSFLLCNVRLKSDEKHKLASILLFVVKIDENIVDVYSETADFYLDEFFYAVKDLVLVD